MNDLITQDELDELDSITEATQRAGEDFFAANQVENRQNWETLNQDYKYNKFYDAPNHHRKVAHWAFLGRNVQTISNLTSLRPKTIVRILAHPPITQWVETMLERKRLEKEKWNKDKTQAAAEGFNVVRGIIKGDEKPEKTRLDAAKVAMSIDPEGRFEPYNVINDTKTPLTTDSLKDYLAQADIIDIKATEPPPQIEEPTE